MSTESPPAPALNPHTQPDDTHLLSEEAADAPDGATGSEVLRPTVHAGLEAGPPDPAAGSFVVHPSVPVAPPAIPERIGRYRVIRKLGEGGFGTVYLCHDAEADRQVAVKVPRADRMTSEQAKQAFLAEARHAAKLKHPGIVTLYEVGEADGQYFLVYEYIE